MLDKNVPLVYEVKDLDYLIHFYGDLFFTDFIILEKHITVNCEEKGRFFILIYDVTEGMFVGLLQL